MSPLRSPRSLSSQAFTLLEVILALAILGIALATLGQAVGKSHENARRAADQATLSAAAASVLDELIVGARPLAAVIDEPLADANDPQAPSEALVSIAIEAGPFDGLLLVRVTARPNLESALAIDAVELVRWMVDPAWIESATSAEETF